MHREWSQEANDVECPVEMTRSQLLSLRNNQGLEVNCHYIINDYNRANVGAASILLHAVGVGILSTTAMVSTTYDNLAWRSKYDIDTNRITSLEDNRGNKVYGQSGNEVDRFPWGNVLWRETTVDNADVFVNQDTPLRSYNNEFKTDSSVTLTGAAGYVYNSTFENDCIVTFLNATAVASNGTKFHSRSRLYAERVAGITLLYHTSMSESYWQVRDQADVRSYYSTFGSACRIYYYGGTSHWFYYNNFSSYAFVRQYAGSIKAYYSDWASYAEIRNEASAGDLFTYSASSSGRAYIRNYNAGRSRIYYSEIQSSGRLTFNAGGGNRDLRYSTISDLATLNFNDGATLVYSSNINSQAIFTVNGGTHYRDFISSYSRVTTAFNTRSVTTFGSFAQTLTAANSNTYRGLGQNNLI